MNQIHPAILFCILVSGCNTPETISTHEEATIKKEIQGRLDGYATAVKSKDLAWIQDFWADDDNFVFAGDGQLNSNYDSAITKSYQNAFAALKEMTYIRWTDGHPLVLSRDVVSYPTNFQWQAVMESGDTVRAKGSWLYLFKKSEGQWKVVHSAGTHIYN